MDFSKLTSAEKIIAGSGAALLILSVVPWFGFGAGAFEVTHDAWDNPFSLLAVLIGAVMAAQVIAARMAKKPPTTKVPWGRVHLILGGAALGLVLLQYIVGDQLTVGLTIDLERRSGLFLGLIAAAGLAYGGFRRSQEPEPTTL